MLNLIVELPTLTIHYPSNFVFYSGLFICRLFNDAVPIIRLCVNKGDENISMYW